MVHLYYKLVSNQVIFESYTCLCQSHLIYDRNQEEQHARLVVMLERLRKEGVTLNKDKYQFNLIVISF